MSRYDDTNRGKIGKALGDLGNQIVSHPMAPDAAQKVAGEVVKKYAPEVAKAIGLPITVSAVSAGPAAVAAAASSAGAAVMAAAPVVLPVLGVGLIVAALLNDD